ncbi:bromodomain adjacent to zinc finger domain protein 2B [Biomphalaria glabrata]|nr:bromodomain adjacent to zinc finger domain protein 2B [Biomphalaria glabrata]
MSKEEKKSSPSPSHGLLFDPSHLLGVHPLAASGFPFPHLGPLSNPYSLLGQPPRFPALFGGLGGIPNPLHAAALSHSLAAASYFGLSKHHNEINSPPAPSPIPTAHKRGRSSRASTSSYKQSSRLSPSSTSPHTPSSPYLPPWSINGSTLPYSNLGAEPKSKSSSSSKRQKLSAKSESRESSHSAPHAHQQPHSSPLLTIPSAHSVQDHKPSTEKTDAFAFDPRAMITPYQMSPELAYMSQSLFLHRPELGLPSHFLASAAASLPAHVASSSSSSSAVKNKEAGQRSSPSVPSSSKHSSSKISSSSSKVDRSKVEKDRPTHHAESSKKHQTTSNGIKNVDSKSAEPLDCTADDKNLSDLAVHMLDGDRKKQIAEHIRKRVGMYDLDEDIVRHGTKHSDWPYAEPSGEHRHNSDITEKQRDLHLAEVHKNNDMLLEDLSVPHSSGKKLNLKLDSYLGKCDITESESHKREEPLHNKSSYGEESMSSTLDESCESIGHSEHEESKLDNSSASENVDVGSHSGSDSEDSGKNVAEGSTDEGSPNKKKPPTQLDERELIIPLEHGWNRQTIINGMGRRGIVGEVLYFAPCGKKMKTIPDVMRYLERNPNSDLGREHFSFNTKVNIGHFYEVRGGPDSQPVPLSDAEVLEKIEMSRGKRARMQMLARQRREKAAREQAMAQQVMDLKLKRRMELQDMSQQATISRLEKKQEKLKQKELDRQERDNKVLERRKEKEQHKINKQQEKIRLQEQLRKERELKAQQIVEARNRRQRELEEMRLADALQRNKERDMKRQQLVIMKEQERERRRQHLLLLKGLEQRKRLEEKQTKERLREEKLHEKIKQKEIKLHQRRVEMEIAMELKKPVEDMELKNAKPIPEFPRIKSKLAGRPIADCLMAVEFLNNFGLALNLEKSSIPTLESLERGILNESDEDIEEFMSLIMHLLRFALDDVGVPNPKEAVTKLHQKITEMEMTDTTMSEILRIFLKARGEKEMMEWLTEKPMEALNPTKKAAILAFLCNELLTSKVIANEIDKHMDAINNLRRDKWVVEGQLRQLRVFQARKFNKIHKSTDRRPAINSSISQDEDTMNSSKIGSDEDDDKDEEDDKEDDEGSESDESSSVITNSSSSNMPFEPVDENLTKEESDKKIEKLRKQHAAYRQKVFRASLRLRAINIGQDRYKRTYWILPLTGGVYVEGMESGVPEDYVAEQAKKEEVKEQVTGSAADESSDDTVMQIKKENCDPAVSGTGEKTADDCTTAREEGRENFMGETICTELSPACLDKVKVNLASKLEDMSESIHQSKLDSCDEDSTSMTVDEAPSSFPYHVTSQTYTSINLTSFDKNLATSDKNLASSEKNLASSDSIQALIANSPSQNVMMPCKLSPMVTNSASKDATDNTLDKKNDPMLKSPTNTITISKPELSGSISEPATYKHAFVSDILKVPKIGGVDRGTLVTLLNNSIQQAYQEEESESNSEMTSTPVTTSSTPILTSMPTVSPSLPSLLTSSLLFSAIPKLPQQAHSATLDLTCKPKGQAPLESSVITSTPVPAHSKPVNPQSLPPFHPSAQANHLLDLPPPAAHSGYTKTPALPPPGPPLPFTQSPYHPNLSHYPFGPTSASETLSSLASIVSPPPAHHNPVTTSSISSPLTTSSVQQPLTPSFSPAKNVFPKLEKNDKDPLYSSSELLQQAATHVLRSAESVKSSPLSTITKSASLKTLSEDDDAVTSEVVDHKLWFSILPRMPCDELSLTQRLPGQSPSLSQQSQQSISASLSALTTYMNSPTNANFDVLLPHIQSNPGLLSSDLLFTSIFNSPMTPSPSPTPCSTPGVDSAGEFKVPPPPDMNLSSYPWEVLRAVQGEAQPIPKRLQHGWWRIYDLAMLKEVMTCMLNRGIREKNLQRSIHRYLDYAKLHCEFDTVKTEPETTPDASQNNSDVKIKTEKQSDDCQDDTSTEPSAESEAKLEEPAEEKVPVTENAAAIENAAATGAKEEVAVQTDKSSCDINDFNPPDDPDWWSVSCLHQIELAALEEVEALEERIFQASLQAKQGWKPNKDNSIIIVDRSVKSVADNESYPLDVAISRLLELEANIERRYLKPPLIRSVQLNLSSLSQNERCDGDFGESESIPPGLLLWRQAVVGSESPAQLSLCTQLLAKSISWEKSIMRVTCQICSKDDNEAELLLCDGCDKGYHTYCFKPKMDNIPDGDWYCFECVSKASGTPHCVVCGAPGGRIVGCSKCPRHIHLECLDPPLPRMPKRWQCCNCVNEKGSSKRSKKRKESLPTVQRISITKLVVKEEPIDAEEMSMASSSSCHTSPPVSFGSSSPEKSARKNSVKSQETPQQQGADKKKRKRKDKEEDLTSPPPPKKKKEKKEKKEKKSQEKVEELNGAVEESDDNQANNKDLIICGKLLSELEKHEDGWPFLKPVNKKQFPSYKKYIKFPMDFATARGKIKSKEYKHRQEFAADMRLIFNNCETFNEDDSDVGQAGFKLRQFFESRWLDMFPDDAP